MLLPAKSCIVLAEQLAVLVHDRCWSACRPYHAKMKAEERERVHNDWTHDRVQIIAATIAFGMGTAALAHTLLRSAGLEKPGSWDACLAVGKHCCHHASSMATAAQTCIFLGSVSQLKAGQETKRMQLLTWQQCICATLACDCGTAL